MIKSTAHLVALLDRQKQKLKIVSEFMFNNKSQLGAFGEYVYKTYCESIGFNCKRTNYCHTDFMISNQANGEVKYIDVKTTLAKKNRYSGVRYGEDIAYDLVYVNEDYVYIYPDKNSPLFSNTSIKVGEVAELEKHWRQYQPSEAKLLNERDIEIFEELKGIFKDTKYKKIRLIQRGDASQKRWSGTIDNLPGSESLLSKYSATVFVQFGCSGFAQIVDHIIFFPHEFISTGAVKMGKLTDRQHKKGIKEVIDISMYKNDHPDYVFKSLEDVRVFSQSLSCNFNHGE